MDPLKAEQFQSALRDLLASDAFQRSPALGRLLTYLVQRTLAGESATLKESVIGHELYDRPASYDPKLDSVVRVSANRLRVRLEDHYRANPDQRVRLVLPKGSYVPFLDIAEKPSPEFVDLSASQPIEFAPVIEPPLTADHVSPPRPAHWVFWAVALSLLFAVGGIVLWRYAHRESPPIAEATWNARPFARLGGSQQFGVFSPDGSQLAFASTATSSHEKSIYIQSVSSEDAHRIAFGVRPEWSPDGKRLAFLRSQPDGREQIILHTLATGNETVLAELEGTGSWLCQFPRLSWSPDGGTIYTTSSKGHTPICGLVTINIATHVVHPLIAPATLPGDLEPAVSPDGKTVAFMRGLATGASDIFTVSASGRGDVHRVTTDGTDLLGLAWTPDGRAVIIASSREGGRRRLWRFTRSGGVGRAFPDGFSDPSFPSVSKGGNDISFTQFLSTAPLWKAVDGKLVELLDNQSRNTKPTISADGKLLLYESNRAGNGQVWLSRPDGSEAHPLLRNISFETGGPHLSPDGNRVVMECHVGKRMHICLSNVDGTALQQITDGVTSQFHPSWSRDGQFLYYTSAGASENIFRMELTSHTVQQITQHGAYRALESWDGKWLFAARPQPAGGFVILPVAGSEADRRAAESDPVLKEIAPDADWNVCKDGILYVVADEVHSPHFNIFDIKTRKSITYLTLSGEDIYADLSIGVMPDGKGILYTATHTSSQLSIMSTRK